MKSLKQCLLDLEEVDLLVRITDEVDPNLELAEIQRRAYLAGAPAILFENVKGTDFPCVGNLYGTMARCQYMFRKTIKRVKHAIRLKADPPKFLKGAIKEMNMGLLGLPLAGYQSLPKKISPKRAPVLKNRTTVDALPAIKSWPMDGGPFITLPQVYSQSPLDDSVMKTNVGMYRVQMWGNEYEKNAEMGLHYQIHRGIGIHHTEALEAGQPLRVTIAVGGHPALGFAAVMPLPENLSELMFAGMLGGGRFRYCMLDGHIIPADADFVITGVVEGTSTKPEGPFGDHLGYYSLTHEFPLLKVTGVYHRDDAIWPFTVVGRPPQEDTMFGKMIHELTAPMVPVSLPGVDSLHAVDAAGVHPLLLAIGNERYVPYQERRPQELLTQANAILGFNQCSLAKFLFIAARQDDPELMLEDIEKFLKHILARADWTRDLHFQTRTTIDTLDYSGTGLNEGSKLVIAAAGKEIRALASYLPSLYLGHGFKDPQLALPGVLVIEGPAFEDQAKAQQQITVLAETLGGNLDMEGFPLVVVADDSHFSTRNLNNFLWSTFTRTNPAYDVYGVDAFVEHKHWGCRGSLIFDARIKPHHAPPLVEDPDVCRRIEEMRAPGGELNGLV